MQKIYRCAGALLYFFSALASANADWVLRGGKVYSMDATASHYSALAIEGNRLVWMGDSDAAASYIGPDTRLIELDGRVVFPGFIDTHIHSMDTLPLINGVKLSPYQSAEEVLAAIAEHARTHPYQNPLLGSGFLAPAFGDSGPTAAQLDAVVSDRPALIVDEGGHTAWANSMALAAAGVNRDTPDPVPGAHFFQRDEDGNPTGWLVEGAAIDSVSEVLGVVTAEALEIAAPGFFKQMSSVGLTAAFDAGNRDHDVSQNIDALLEPIAAERPVIVDLGCAGGRDLVALTARGCEAWGVEGSSTFCELARRAAPGWSACSAAA